MRKRKLILLMVATSSLMFNVGCSKNQTTVINGVEVIDVSKAEIDKSKTYQRKVLSSNPDDIKKYDILELTSKKIDIDAKNLEYNLELTFKNNSKKTINNLSIDLTLYSPSENATESFDIDGLKPNAKTKKSLSVSLTGLVNDYFEEKYPTKKELKKVLSKLAQDDNDFFKYHYTYENNNSEKIEIGYEFDSDFNTLDSYVKIFKELSEEEQNKLTINHEDNGSYLNLISPQEDNDFVDIEASNIVVDIDDNFNFNIKGKFKNISNKELSDFTFLPSLYVNGLEEPLYLTQGTSDSYIKTIKPKEEFNINTTISKDKLFSFMDKELLEKTPCFKGKNISEILSYSLKDRLITFSYRVEYKDNKYKTFISNSYDSKSALSNRDISKIHLD